MGKRLKRLIEMPRLTRSRRNQRLTIVALTFMLGLYLMIWPALSGLFEGRPRDDRTSVSAAPTGLKKK